MANTIGRNEGGLMEYLQELLQCAFLSDLRQIARADGARIWAILKAVPEGAYPLKQWQDASQYFLQDALLPGTEQEARRLLESKLAG